jgi:hypothetical protein
MRKHVLVGMTAILVSAMATGALAADDPHIGTWKMNAAKSKSSSTSDTVRFEPIDNGIKVVGDYVDAEGKIYHEEMTAKYDGKDYPYHGGHMRTRCRLKE